MRFAFPWRFKFRAKSEKAIGYWLQAGQRAQSLSANVESLDHFNRGLVVVLSLPEAPKRLGLELNFQLGLSVSLMALHGYAAPHVEEKLDRARVLCEKIGPGAPQFPVLWANWAWRLVGDKLEGAGKFSKELMEIAYHTKVPALIAEAELTRACTSMWVGDYESTLSSAEASLDNFDLKSSLESMAFTGQNVGVMASQFRVINLWCLGFYDKALAAREEGLQLTAEVNHPFSATCFHWHCGLFSVFAQNAELARQDADIGLSVATEHGYPYWIGMNTMLDGAVVSLEGDLKRGVIRLREGIDKVLATGAVATISLFETVLAETLRQLDRHAEAKSVLRDASNRIDANGGRFSQINLLLAQARLEDDPESGQALAKKAVEFAENRKAPYLALRSALVLDELGGDSIDLIRRLYRSVPEGEDAPDMINARARLR